MLDGARKRVEIEALLRWAYRDELPKDRRRADCGANFVSGWSAVSDFGQYLALIDAPVNEWGVLPACGVEAEPHPDAQILARAVCELDEFSLSLPEGWSPFGDFGDLGVLGDAAISKTVDRLTYVAPGLRMLRTPPSFLLRKFAILGGCPVWQAEKPEVKFICGANGKPRWFVRRMVTCDASDEPFEIEADGWSNSQRRPVHGAYRKEFLDPDPVDVGVARGEYEIWRASLDILVEGLSACGMSAHVATASARAIRPWESDVAVGRVLPDLT